MANVVVSALATWNGKALKKGQKDISAFDKQATKLGNTLTRAFTATAIVAFSKKAITAFADDEKAARSLAVQLQNTGNAFRVDEVEAYIAKLQDMTGVLDDQLRPAFQTLLNVTGSVDQSFKVLETALNVSAGTTESLETVINAISAGIRGKTNAIKGLNTGIDANIIKTGDMNKIMTALEKRFSGQAAARLDTFAGKMDLLKAKAADATEIIGKGLITALDILTKDNSIDEASNAMNTFALAIVNTTKGMAILVGEVKSLVNSDVGKFLLALVALLTLGKGKLVAGAVGLVAYDIGKNTPLSEKDNIALGRRRLAERVLEAKLTSELNKLKKFELDTLKKKTAVDLLREKFDVERVGLNAALNSATDEETKLRLRSQLAILDDNEAVAKKLLAEMNAIEALRALDDAARKLAEAMAEAAKKMGDAAEAAYKRLAVYDPVKSYGATNSSEIATALLALDAAKKTLSGLQQGTKIDTSNSIINGLVNPNYIGMPPAITSYDPLSSLRVTKQEAMEIKVTIDAGGDRLSQAIAESIQVATRSGYSTVPAGFL
jgi:hypothetical protein